MQWKMKLQPLWPFLEAWFTVVNHYALFTTSQPIFNQHEAANCSYASQPELLLQKRFHQMPGEVKLSQNSIEASGFIRGMHLKKWAQSQRLCQIPRGAVHTCGQLPVLIIFQDCFFFLPKFTESLLCPRLLSPSQIKTSTHSEPTFTDLPKRRLTGAVPLFALKQLSGKVSNSLMLVLFFFFFPFFPYGPYAALFSSRSLKRMFTLHSPSFISVTISGSPLSEYFWEDLRSMLFTSGRYLNVCHICFSHCSIFTGISYQFQIWFFFRCDQFAMMNSCNFWSLLSQLTPLGIF